jgi:hypothetical protein
MMNQPNDSPDESELDRMNDELYESLELLIERNNPMANAAQKTLEMYR